MPQRPARRPWSWWICRTAAVDPLTVIAEAKARGARVLAFGRHTDAASMRAARAAGADTVVARSQLVEELPHLIEALIGAGSR